MNTSIQLEIKRSNQRLLRRWPTWINVLSISATIILILVVSVWTVMRSEKALESSLSSKLTTILNLETEAVRQWVQSERQMANYLASDVQVVDLMVSASGNVDDTGTIEAGQSERLLSNISRRLRNKTCLLMTTDGNVVVSSGDNWLKESVESLEAQFCKTLMLGKTTVSPVFAPVNESNGTRHFGLVVAAPIEHPEFGIIGFLGVGHSAEEELTNILRSSRNGRTGEVVAVSMSGELISQSRIDDENRYLDFAAPVLRSAREQSYQTTVELDGHADHRGVPTIFASRWLPTLGIGLVAKMDQAEASAPVSQIRMYVWTLFGFLLLTTLTTLFYRFYVYRLRLAERQSELRRKQIGAYELEGKVGEGGMGVVYRAKHAMMRRPTAVKVLPPEKSCPSSIERFEREVQLTSQLKHPNSIAIYDYGRSDNGLFYYAMELLDGVNLEQLIQHEHHLTDGRAINILRQLSASLSEAHSLNLVHRDIKPANIMLCNRGGAVDMVKVLDFGMVRETSSTADNHLLSGTPAYMAPESFIQPSAVDARADIFAVGAVGFFLITGEPLLEANNLQGLLNQHRNLSHTARRRMQESLRRAGRDVSHQLIDLICKCVSPNPDDRPQTIEAVLTALTLCQPHHKWYSKQALEWWHATDNASFANQVQSHDQSQQTAVSLALTQEFVPSQPIDQELPQRELVESAP